MADRLDLHATFEDILGSSNVYFSPPGSIKMKYDAIRYKVKTFENKFANNFVYLQDTCYEVIAIYRDPESDLPRKISRLPKCRHDRQYVADNLIHDVFTLYH